MLVTLHHGLQLELVTLNIVLSVVTDEPVEFKKQLVRIHDFKKITDRSKRIYEIFFNLIRKKPIDVSMQPVYIDNTRISTVYAQKSSKHCINMIIKWT